MSTEYSTISSCPANKWLPISTPYCLFRNRYQYILDAHDVDYIPKADGDYSKQAENQTFVYMDNLSYNHIPSHLLYGSLRRDIVPRTVVKIDRRRQVLTCIQCPGSSKFLHVGGRNKDEVIIRDVRHSFYASCLLSPPGFTLPLTGGAEICEVTSCGTMQWSSKVNILARTRAELHHLCTMDMDDVISGKEASSSASASVIIEPVQKWQLPFDIASMCASPSGWSTTNIITTCGRVFSWSLGDGIKSVNNNKPILASNDVVLPTFDMSIECTLHPQVSYTVHKDNVFSLDMRCPQHTSLLYTAASSNSIAALKQHGGIAHHFMASDGNYVRLIDARFPRTPVAQQYIPGGHNSIKFIKTPNSHTAGQFTVILSD